jgi:predicted deacylase
VQSLDREDYRFAPESGMYESCVDPGEPVVKGQVVGRIHFLERPDRAAAEVVANGEGMLIAGRAPSMVKQGDCVACIAHDVDPYNLPE